MAEETVLYRGLDKTGEHVEYVYVQEPKSETGETIEPTLRRTVLSSASKAYPEESLSSITSSFATKFLNNRRLLVVNSTNSGERQSTLIYERVLRPLLEGLGITHDYVPTQDASTITKTAQTGLLAGQNYLIVIFGGDTSLSEFVNTLLVCDNNNSDRHGRIDFVLVPTGSGNAISVSSIGGTKSPIAKTIAALLNSSDAIQAKDTIKVSGSTVQGTFVPLPTVRVEFPSGSYLANAPLPSADPLQLHALVVVSWAFHAALVADSDIPEYRKLGVTRFYKAAESNLRREQCYRGDIKLFPSLTSSNNSSSSNIKLASDNSTHSYVLFALVSKVEQGYCISPSTRYGHTDSNGRPDLYFLRIPFELPNNENNAEFTRLVTLPGQHGALVHEPNVDYLNVNPAISGSGEDGIAGVITAAPGQGPQRWCVDGLIVVVPDGAGPVVVHGAYSGVATSNWDLNILI